MTTEMETIKNSLQSRVSTLLSDFKSLSYVENIEDNNWNQIERGYGVRALTASEISGVNKVYTLLQDFEVTLTSRYLQSQTGDNLAQDLSFTLRGHCLDIYKDAVNTKAGAPASVMNVSNIFIDVPEIMTESKVVVQRMEFQILYRISLI